MYIREGLKISHLTVLGDTGKRQVYAGGKVPIHEVICDCGKVVERTGNALWHAATSNTETSCGCCTKRSKRDFFKVDGKKVINFCQRTINEDLKARIIEKVKAEKEEKERPKPQPRKEPSFRIQSDEAAEDLAIATIERAVEDYAAHWKALAKGGALPNDISWSKLKYIERFFTSEWYGTLSNTDGLYILDRVKQELTEKYGAIEK